MRNTGLPVHTLEGLNAVSFVAYIDVQWRDVSLSVVFALGACLN